MASAQPATPQRRSADSRGLAAGITSLASAVLAPVAAMFSLSTFMDSAYCRANFRQVGRNGTPEALTGPLPERDLFRIRFPWHDWPLTPRRDRPAATRTARGTGHQKRTEIGRRHG